MAHRHPSTTPNMEATLFNSVVPTFRTPNDDIYRKLLPLLEEHEQSLRARLQPTYELTPTEERLLERAAILRTCYEETPGLDLVLTPTGFGIVSNQSTAPASPARVQALREQLRKGATTAEDLLSVLLLAHGTEALKDPRSLCPHLISRPSECQEHGLRTPDGRTIYREELPQVLPAIQEAEHLLEKLISPELFALLLEHQWTSDAADVSERHTAIDRLLFESRQFIAAHVQRSSPAVLAIHRQHLLRSLRLSEELLPEYLNSATRRAQLLKPYENKRTDPSFFFS